MTEETLGVREVPLETVMPKSWRSETKPHSFCPGCGHPLALRALGEIVDEMGLLPRMLYGCDIGCSLLSWNFFNFDIIQTHHGRTVPVLVGAKRARPELVTVAYVGDGGGYAIGAQHLVNAAVRGERITVILGNNTVYAMTGGQMAPTTLPGQETATSPHGRDPQSIGMPTLGPEMVAAIAPKGSYVARAIVSNARQMKGFIRKAIENQVEGNGFSFVEVLTTCPTNWGTNAKESWGFLENDMAKVFKVGEFPVQGGGGEGDAK